MLRRLTPLLLLWLCFAFQGASSAVRDLDSQESSQEFFRNAPVCELHLTVALAALEALKKESRRFVEATVREGSNTYAKVGVHLKGNSSFRPIDGDKPSF